MKSPHRLSPAALGALFALLLALILAPESIAAAPPLPLPMPTASLEATCQKGERFLTNLFQPGLNLLPEYSGAKVVWLYHDNYLAAKLLARSHPALTAKIQGAIRTYGVTNSGKIEILFDEAPHPLPFQVPELVTVAASNGFLVRTEKLTSQLQIGWEQYADLLLFAALALRTSSPAQAQAHYESALAMWDGRGFLDQATRHSNRYATYKLALALIASGTLKANLPMRQEILERLFSLQAPSGGWITDYEQAGKPRGLANVETTCLVLLALHPQFSKPTVGITTLETPSQ